MLWILIMSYCTVNNGCSVSMLGAHDSLNKCQTESVKSSAEAKKKFESEPSYTCQKISKFTKTPYEITVPRYYNYGMGN